MICWGISHASYNIYMRYIINRFINRRTSTYNNENGTLLLNLKMTGKKEIVVPVAQCTRCMLNKWQSEKTLFILDFISGHLSQKPSMTIWENNFGACQLCNLKAPAFTNTFNYNQIKLTFSFLFNYQSCNFGKKSIEKKRQCLSRIFLAAPDSFLFGPQVVSF